MNAISLAVWDVPMPVVAGEQFSIKVGAKAAAGGKLTGSRVQVIDANDTVVASGALGDKTWPDSEALYWTAIDMPAPITPQVTEYTVRMIGGKDHETASRFSVVSAEKPQHTLTVTITEKDSKTALDGVEIRLGAFHARTDKSGRAEVRVCKGTYQLQLWRTAHIAEPQPIAIDGDKSVALTMVHVPEEHPDARWVR